ncbi:MAG: hypothetical protein RLZZ352_2298 [Pseudomonadota bacterium]
MVLECAVAPGSRYLLTHNLRDFRKITRLNIEPLIPTVQGERYNAQGSSEVDTEVF